MMRFAFLECAPVHIDEILAIQEDAFAHMEHPDWLRRNPREMLLACLGPPHVTVGAFVGTLIAGFAILYFGERTEENLGRSLGFSGEALPDIANFKLAIVRPQYRGHSLQRCLAAELETIARQRGVKLLCATVHPGNVASRVSMERSGYRFAKQLIKYGGLQRDLYCKELCPGYLDGAIL